MENRTCLTPIWRFDSTLSSDTIQYFNTRTEYTKNKSVFISSLKKLMNYGIISPRDKCRVTNITVCIDKSDGNEHSLTNYQTPIAHASYCFDISTSIACVGLIYIERELQKLGYGTQLKKIINNRIKQEDATVAFTYPCSNGGRKLCLNTGYRPVKGRLSESNLWIKEFKSRG